MALNTIRLGMRTPDELLFRLEEMKFLDGSTSEEVYHRVSQTGSVTVQIEWRD
jgi:hypothetical protein